MEPLCHGDNQADNTQALPVLQNTIVWPKTKLLEAIFKPES